MRKVTKLVVAAFLAGKAKSVANTSTDGVALLLHGNRIAERAAGGFIISDCGWPTVTTRDRLNALPGVSVYQAKGQQYLNGVQWDGKPVFVPA